MFQPIQTILCVLISTCLHSVLNAQISDSIKKKDFNIDNCVNEFNTQGCTKTKSGYQYWFIDSTFIDGRTIKLSVVKPGASTHAPHKHKQDEIFFILEGTAEFYLDGHKKIVGSNTSLYCPPNLEHNLKNVGKTELKYLVIKKY